MIWNVCRDCTCRETDPSKFDDSKFEAWRVGYSRHKEYDWKTDKIKQLIKGSYWLQHRAHVATKQLLVRLESPDFQHVDRKRWRGKTDIVRCWIRGGLVKQDLPPYQDFGLTLHSTRTLLKGRFKVQLYFLDFKNVKQWSKCWLLKTKEPF